MTETLLSASANPESFAASSVVETPARWRTAAPAFFIPNGLKWNRKSARTIHTKKEK